MKFSPEQLEQEKKDILAAYKQLCLALGDRLEDSKTQNLFREAFELAVDSHKEMRRKSGEPYIFHPIEVARITIQEIGLGVTSAICALLHDTVEDTELTLKDVEKKFGPKITKIIDGLTKISSVIDYNNSTTSDQLENFRKILLTLGDDIRVILVKLADRLHNMRTLSSMKREKQMKIASETLYLYAPLAHRLGLYNIKTELEDLSLKYLQPDVYEEIQNKLDKTKEVRDRFIKVFTVPIKKLLDQEGIKCEIKGRVKSIYSIYNKVKVKNIPFEEIYDIFAIRIIIDTELSHEKADCWRVYSALTDLYKTNSERLRDWITTPRTNGYESLHTTVMSPTGKWVEVQIRTKRMDEIAEKGFAAHWKYKEQSVNKREQSFDQWVTKVREILDQSLEENAFDLVSNIKSELFAEEIFVFTPKGELKTIAAGSTALDFAYYVHSDLGNKCLGAKVNNKLVPISHVLNSGDQVEIITSSKQKPREDWLSIVQSSSAKNKIRKALQEGKRQIASLGREILERKFKNHKVPYTSQNLEKLAKHFKASSVLDLEYFVGAEKIDISNFKEILQKKENHNYFNDIIEHNVTPKELLKKYKEDTLLIGDDMDKIDYTLSQCCQPIPGDEVFGFVTVKDGITIHKVSCTNAVTLLSNYAYRVVKARWVSHQKIAFLAGIKITGLDGVGIVNAITKIISEELNVNMRSISFDSNDGIFEGNITVYVYDTEHLKQLMVKLSKVEGVLKTQRIDYN